MSSKINHAKRAHRSRRKLPFKIRRSEKPRRSVYYPDVEQMKHG